MGLHLSGGGGTAGTPQIQAQVAQGAPGRTITSAIITAALSGPYKYFLLPPGTITLDAPVTMPAGSTLDGCGTATVVKIANGVTSSYVIGGIGDGSGVGQSFTLGSMIVDGNKAGGSKQTTSVVYFEQPSDLQITGPLHCRNGGATVPGTTAQGAGFRLDGMGLPFTYNVKIPEIHTYGNDGHGIEISHTTRKTLIGNVYTHDNLGHGYWFDASEQNVDMITSWNNAQRGVYLNNAHSCNVGQIYAFSNGWTGIWVEEFVYSRGHDWVALGNGASDPTIKAEVCFFDAATQTYGVTTASEVHGIHTHTRWFDNKAAQKVSDYGVYVGDGVVDRVTLTGVETGDSGKVAPLRLPANPGSLVVRDAPGNLLTTAKETVNIFYADPGMASGNPLQYWTGTSTTRTNATYLGLPAVKWVCTGTGTAHNVTTNSSNAAIDVSGYATNQAFSITADVAMESGTFAGVQLSARFFDAGAALVQNQNAVNVSGGVPVGSGYTRIVGHFTKPATSTTLRVMATAKPDSETGTLYIRNVMVTPDNAIYPYGDGATVGWRWDGTAFASTSRKPVTSTSSLSGSLLAVNNLSDLASPSTALANIGADAAGAAAAVRGTPPGGLTSVEDLAYLLQALSTTAISDPTTIPRLLALQNTAGTTVAGRAWFTYFTAKKSGTFTKLRSLTGATAATATPTASYMGIYSVDGSNNLTQIGVTATDTTMFTTAQTVVERATVASYTLTKGQRYAFATLNVGTAGATFWGCTALGSSGLATEIQRESILFANVASQTTLASSYTAATMTTTGSSAGMIYGVCVT